ncbi:hypothetical protein LXL04_023057 [Taraxacum kok-saghyz]
MRSTKIGIRIKCEGIHSLIPKYTVPPDVWFGAFPTRDYNVSMVDWEYYSVVKNAPRDAEKCFSLVGTTVASAFEWRKDAGDEGGAMNGRTIDCDCDIFVVVGGFVLEESGSGTDLSNSNVSLTIISQMPYQHLTDRSVIFNREWYFRSGFYEDKALAVHFHSIARCLDVKVD